MGCESCAIGTGDKPAGCKNNGNCGTSGCNKLTVFDWLSNMELPANAKPYPLAEIRFKNGRKDFFYNSDNLSLYTGDTVVVEGNPGYDVGMVSLTGELVRLQVQKKNASPNGRDHKRILRKANSADIAIWQEARSIEDSVMFRSREIAQDLHLHMKISDVEFQGDKTKAIFYYTAEGRIDFRELIKKLAEEFRIRVEMKQIGARQEAGRLGGIGSCGRELCCSTWLTDFRSVSTGAARYQQLSLNPQKLAGQCGKLKCCLNYELDMYVEALKHFPKNSARLSTKRGIASHMKTDIFKGLLWYIYQDVPGGTPIALTVDRVKEILRLNESGVLPEDLREFEDTSAAEPTGYANVDGQDSLTRFDKAKRSKKGGKRKKQFSGGGKSGNNPNNAAPKTGGKPKKSGRRNNPRKNQGDKDK